MHENLVILNDGSEAFLRPVTSQDLEMVWNMLSTLSKESLRFLPHPIIREEIEQLMTHVDYEVVLPIVTIIGNSESNQRIVAIATLTFQQGVARRHRAEFDIIVHDDYQGKGLGTILTQHMIDIARVKGLKKIHLKTDTKNLGAVHVYKKLGFIIEGQLTMEHYHYLRKEYGDDYRMAILL